MTKKISLKHQEFANRYLICKNATTAYMQVYPRSKRESAWRSASDLLRIPEVLAYIEERFKSMQMSADEVMARLRDQATADLRPFVRVNGDGAIFFDFSNPEAVALMHMIKKIKTKRTRRMVGRGERAEEWEDEWVEVELHDAQAALKLIGQQHKIFSDRMEMVHSLSVDGLEEALTKIWSKK